MIKVKDAFFVKSASKMEETTPEGMSEVAFIGRSNVGKSSIINALTNKKGLAKSSSTPGKTRLINFFQIVLAKDEKTYHMQLVDLPGFGYARVPHSLKEEWQKNLTMNQKKYYGEAEKMTYEPTKSLYTLEKKAFLHEIETDKKVYGDFIRANQNTGQYEVDGKGAGPVKFIFKVEDKKQ